MPYVDDLDQGDLFVNPAWHATEVWRLVEKGERAYSEALGQEIVEITVEPADPSQGERREVVLAADAPLVRV